MPKWFPCFIAAAAIAASFGTGRQTTPATSKVDTDVEQLHYAELEHDLSSVPPGPERDLFAAQGVSTTSYTSFDPMGRVTASSQATAGQTYSFSYAYNLAGSLVSETYPSGRIIATGYDEANRPDAMTGTLSQKQTPYVGGVSYAPLGSVSSEWFGNGLTSSYSFNNRLQPVGITAGTPEINDLYTLGFGWGSSNNNGNLQSETIALAGGPSFSQTYGYDTLNRVQSASDSGGWSQSLQYDAFGNMWETTSGVQLVNSRPTSNIYNASTNRMSTATYDAAGNQTSIANVFGSMIYDAENRMNQAITGSGTVTYAYDADGQRVEKVFGGSPIVYVYDALGQLAAEYSAAPSVPPCTTCYLTADHLGSTRMVTDQSGTLASLHDYLPFGEEIGTGYAGRSSPWGLEDAVNQKFTGKERDSESGFDYFGARYYGSALGRFTSPDDGSDQIAANPQSWNLYSYVRNNPLANTDDDGRAVNVCLNDENGNQHCTQMENDQYAAASQGNAGTNVPTLDQVGMNGDGNGNFNSTAITDSNGNTIGTATYVSEGGADYYANRNGINLLATTAATVGSPKGTAAFYGASAIGGAAIYGVGAAIGALSPASVAVPSILTLPAVPSALQKLQNLGISLEQASEMVGNPSSQKLVDNLNGGNINWVQNIGGKMIRVTTDPTGQRIISAGTMRASQISNGIAKGRFTQ